MRLYRLRNLLSLQSGLVATLPFLLAAVPAGLWLYLQTGRDVEADQRRLATAVSAQVQTYLAGSVAAVNAAAGVPAGHLSPHEYNHLLEAQVRASPSLRSLAVVESNGRVAALALAEGSEAQLRDLSDFDLSGNDLVRVVRAQRRLAWSDTYLSVLGGGVSVGVAVPLGDRVVMGEVNLERLALFLHSLERGTDELVLVLDRHGQVIADAGERLTAQQLNVQNLPVVREGLRTDLAAQGSFRFEGRRMIGGVVPIAGVPWHVLAAVPRRAAFQSVMSTVGIVSAGLVGALGVGLFVGVRSTRRLARQFEALTEHAQRVAAGGAASPWPGGRIVELDQLAADLHRMDRAVREREEFLDTLVENIPDVIVVKDAEDLRIVKVNRAAEEFLGQPRRGLVGKRMSDLLPSDEAQRAAEQDRAVLEAREFLEVSDERVTVPGGRERIVHTKRLPLRAPDGSPQYVLCIGSDVTDRRRAEAEKEALQVRLAQAQKLEAIGTLAGGVAHDFNNILSAIVGFTELTLLALPADSPLRDNLERVLEAGDRAAGLVRQILSFARETKRGEGPVHLRPVLEEALKLLRAVLPSTIVIEAELRSEAHVRGDPTELHQILMNLGTNAGFAMPEGGTLSVRLEDAALDEKDCAAHEGAAPGPHVRLTVSDTGVGMPPEILRRVFDPFFTTREPGKGTGLGLATVHGIVRRTDGVVSVESRPGQGTTFQVLLPVAAEEACEPTPDAPAERGGERILFVDDEAMLCTLAERTLGQLGYRVTPCTSSREAAELLRENPEGFDLLVTDMTMPELTGDQLAREARRVKPGLPVILATGYSDRMTPERARELEIDEFLSKPLLMSELSQAIRRVIARRAS